MDAETARREALETWNAMAPGWERWRAKVEETSAPVREWMLRELAPAPSQTVLELAAGPGDVGFAAAELLGEKGRLVSTDFSPAMVEVARRRSVELGLRNVEHRVMDAERIALEDDSVDGVLCRFGYMLMPDSARAMAETRRVLRDGGRLALAVWREAARNPWLSIVGRMLVERELIPRPQPGEPGIFALADEHRLRSLLASAGFEVRSLEDVPLQFVYESLDEYIVRAQDTGGIFARVWREASSDEQGEMRTQMAEAFAPFEVDGRYEFPGLALAASAS